MAPLKLRAWIGMVPKSTISHDSYVRTRFDAIRPGLGSRAVHPVRGCGLLCRNTSSLADMTGSCERLLGIASISFL